MDKSEALTISVETAGRLLGISRGLAYELASQGLLPTLRLGRRLVVPRKALEKMLEAGQPKTSGREDK